MVPFLGDGTIVSKSRSVEGFLHVKIKSEQICNGLIEDHKIS